MTHLSQSFWLLVSFISLFAVSYKFISRRILCIIKKYQEDVMSKIHSARNDKIDSEQLMTDIFSKQADVQNFCDKIISDAKESARQIRLESEEKMDKYIQSKIIASNIRIENLEHAVMDKLKDRILNEAISKVMEYFHTSGKNDVNINELKNILSNVLEIDKKRLVN